MSYPVIIVKPGLQPRREGKTNLQLMEVRALQAMLPTRSKITNVIKPSNDLDTLQKVYVFNSPHKEDMETTFRTINNLKQKIDVVLVVNDLRIPFTNTQQLVVTDKMHNVSIISSGFDVRVYGLQKTSKHLPLFTLPIANYLSKTYEKTKFAAYAGMHYKDYGIERKKIIDKIIKKVDMFGDMPNSLGVYDATEFLQYLKDYKYCPIVLEHSYIRKGLIPNRVSEAIYADCLPIFLFEHSEHRNLYLSKIQDITLANWVDSHSMYVDDFMNIDIQTKLFKDEAKQKAINLSYINLLFTNCCKLL